MPTPPPLGPPPLQTKVTIAGRNGILRGKFLLGHFCYTNFWVPSPPPPPSHTSLLVSVLDTVYDPFHRVAYTRAPPVCLGVGPPSPQTPPPRASSAAPKYMWWRAVDGEQGVEYKGFDVSLAHVLRTMVAEVAGDRTGLGQASGAGEQQGQD